MNPSHDKPSHDSPDESAHIAVDLGAGSGRVVLGRVGANLALEELHRFPNPMEQRDSHLRWNPRLLFNEIRTGIGIALDSLTTSGSGSAAGTGASPPPLTIGVDTWGVDYCLLDASHQLIEDPICYRDPRTTEVAPDVLSVIDADRLYSKTGIQLLHINTLFQLWTHVRSGDWPDNVAAICMMPDLFHLWLSGKLIAEYTEATTSQMLQVRERVWDAELLALIGLPPGCLPPPTQPGARLGNVRGEVFSDLGLGPAAPPPKSENLRHLGQSNAPASIEVVVPANIEVIVPASHDTASAIAGTPLSPRWAFISCGTWSLIGLELTEPELGPLARRYEFSNEGGAENTIAFLKNVTGLWILDSCLEQWRSEGLATDYEDLLAGLAEVVPGGSFIFPDDSRFLGMGNMPERVLGFLRDTEQPVAQSPPEIARLTMDSLALRFAQIIDQLAETTGDTIPGIHVVGGGSQNNYLMQATANAAQLPVVAGPAEATALGNVLVQAIGVGSLPDLTAARRWVRDHVTLRTFAPGHRAEWSAARTRFEKLSS